MNVASLENCKKLYELSGWKDTYSWHCYEWDLNGYRTGEKSVECIDMIEFEETEKHQIVPAYDAGFLLRKLPKTMFDNKVVLTIQPHDETTWAAEYDQVAEDGERFGYNADTPENALTKLAIELFHQKLIERSE